MQSASSMKREIPDSDQTALRLGAGLGWFSIGLGLAELIAPRKMARLVGVGDGGRATWLLRAYGLRELGVGVAMLTNPGSPRAPWARVAGDLLDLATLAFAMPNSTSLPRTIGAAAMVAGATAVDAYAGVRQARRMLGEPVKRAITIARPSHEVYRFWRNFEQFPQFMSWVESVRDLGGGMSHWVVKTPTGVMLEWDAEVTDDVAGRRIAWQSLPGESVPNCGSVTFLDAPGNRGTELIVELQVSAPLGKTIAGMESQGDLHRLKQMLEIGEVVKSDASIHTGPHPARPAGKGGLQ